MNTLTCSFDNLIDASAVSSNLVCTQKEKLDEYKNIWPSLSCYSKTIQFSHFPRVRTDRLIQFTSFQSTDTNCLVEIVEPYFGETKKQLEMVLVNTDQLSEKVAKILGKNGLKRFDAFKRYPKGWDGSNGLPLSYKSIAVMEYFISYFEDFHSEPSLFLTPNGNLQLGWENTHDQVVEIEFYPGKIEFYIEALEKEGQSSLDEQSMNWLVSVLKEND